jgi:murein DD-endopeptidase MepM/ murein hydrolase activator NlpD
MKKKAKNYSVIIVSDATSTSREFVISSKFIKKAVIAAPILVIIFGFIIFDYLTTSFNKEKLRRLEQKVEKKDNEITQYKVNIESLKKDLSQMAEFEKRIKVATGLTSPYALQEVGKGGPGQIQNIDNYEIPNLSQNLTNKSSSLENLTQASKTIVNSLKFVNSVIDRQKVRLASTPMVWPTRGYLTDLYGWRTHPMTGKRDFHHGVDIATQLGNKVMATANGTVLVAEYRDYYGNLVVIDHGYEYATWYGHLASIAVKEGHRVKRGQVIGYVGSTGRSNAPHLHYEVRFMRKPVNPMKFMID